jgi:hypothetical protein
MHNKKLTAWKKSRKFGDIYGGRKRLKLSDNIFARAHSLLKPGINDIIPIFRIDNPSRDFFFPVAADEIMDTLAKLPKQHTNSITHIWLRKVKKSDYEARKSVQACFICGSGVRLIILYPWPTNLLLSFGPKKPNGKLLNQYFQWCSNLINKNGEWMLKWDRISVKKYYLEHLLLHEIGHHVDWYYRHWSAANSKQLEEFANQYAVEWSSVSKELIDNLVS